MPSANRDDFTPFTILMPLISLSCLLALSRMPVQMSTRSESGHCLFPDLRGKSQWLTTFIFFCSYYM